MKTILKVILPVMAFTLASAAAVSTHATKVEEAKNPVVITGFIQNPTENNCQSVDVNCTTTNTGQDCMTTTFPTRRVWLKDEQNACNLNLYKVL